MWRLGQRQTRLPALSGDKPAIARQNAEASREGQAARGSNRRTSDKRPGRWTSFTTSLPPAARSACSRSWTPSVASLQLSTALQFRGDDAVLTLERICKIIGYPKTIRVDQGSEIVSRDLVIGLTRRRSCSTSPGRASRPTTIHRILQREVQKRMSERALVPER
jgi:hypothetical protein